MQTTSQLDVFDDGADCGGEPVVEAKRLCDHACGGQILLAAGARLMARDYEPLEEIGTIPLKGLADPTRTWVAPWSVDDVRPTRVVLADDAVLVREGVAQVLENAGIEVLAQAGDAEELLRLVAELHPDVAIVDVRMPPAFSLEGLEAAERIRVEHPSTAVLLLSQDAQPVHAERLRASSPTAVGLMLKEHVIDVREFVDAVRSVASGGTVFDPLPTRS
jgi:serine/threonine-protein kinase